MIPENLKPNSHWLVMVECILQVIKISPRCDGFFIPGQEPCWHFPHVQDWIAEIPAEVAYEVFEKNGSQPVSLEVTFPNRETANTTAGPAGTVSPEPQSPSLEGGRPDSDGSLPQQGATDPNREGSDPRQDVPLGNRIARDWAGPGDGNRSDSPDRRGPVSPRRDGWQDRVLSELPLYVWLQTLKVPPWLVRAAMLRPAVHRRLSIAKIEGVSDPITLLSVVGKVLCDENELLSQNLIDVCRYSPIQFTPK